MERDEIIVLIEMGGGGGGGHEHGSWEHVKHEGLLE